MNTPSNMRIGNTPLRLVPELTQTIYSKLEYCNPSGSHYDRAYDATIRALLDEGLISQGDGTELRDISSGSAGRSLAYIGKEYGFPVRVSVPSELPDSRVEPLRQLGAKVLVTHGDYVDGASQHQRQEIMNLIDKSVQFSKEWRIVRSADPSLRSLIFEKRSGGRFCYINHSENALSPAAFGAIGVEMVAQIPKKPSAIALAIGNWTTISGIVPVVKRAWPNVRIMGYQSKPSDTYQNFGTNYPGSRGTNVPKRFEDMTLLDEIVLVGDDERDSMDTLINTRRLPEEKIGRSSLMGLCVARQIETTKPVITIAYDQASMY